MRDIFSIMYNLERLRLLDIIKLASIHCFVNLPCEANGGKRLGSALTNGRKFTVPAYTKYCDCLVP